MQSDVYYKVEQHAANVKTVATDMLYHMFCLNTIKCAVSICENGFGGLAASMLASGTQDRGFAPDRSRRTFPAGKIHRMPSFGGEVK
jgi:hypothetical protein